MFNIVVLCVNDPLTQYPDKEYRLPTEFETVDEVGLRALRWLTYRPNDILMMVDA